jgi:hypothetical protein
VDENRERPTNGERRKYSIRLLVKDAETGARRECSLAEAREWDWANREIVRSIGAWHIYDFKRLLAILARKADEGLDEVELVEAPFFMGG